MITTLVILVIAVVLFASGKVRSDLVSLGTMTALLIFQILSPEEALAGFSNSTVIMMAGLFVVGAGILQTGLAKMISAKVLKFAGTSETKLFILVMLATSFIGAFVSNTGTVALMLPIVVSIAKNAGMNPSRLLMPVAFASSMGGMMTLVGTPANMIISDALVGAGYKGMSFFSFFPAGIICVAVGILVLLPLTKIFFSKKKKNEKESSGKSLGQLVKEYGLSSNLFRVRVADEWEFDGKTVTDLDLRKKYSINLLEIRRKAGLQHRFLKAATAEAVTPDTEIHSGDVLYFSGEMENVGSFAEDYGCKLLGGNDTEAQSSEAGLDFQDVGIAEAILMPNSNMINKSISDIGLRYKYNINLLGIRRKKEIILHDLAERHVRAGDVLLVQGTWTDIDHLSKEDNDFVVLGQPMQQAASVTMDHKAPIAAAIMLLMVILMVFDKIGVAPVTAVTIAAILMVVTGCVRSMEAAYKSISWQTIILFAAMLPMSVALDKTGVSAIISNSLATWLGGYSPTVMLAGIYLATSVMTFFLSNTVTAVLMAQISLQVAMTMGINPVPFMLAVSIGASMSFTSPFSTPPNALVMPAGQYTFMDFIKVGLPLQVIMGVVMVLVLPLIFPF